MKVLRYIELKTGYSDDGPAWICHVKLSRSGRSVYFGNRLLNRWNGIKGNFADAENGDEYWVSGVKRNGCDRWGGAKGTTYIIRSAITDYSKITGLSEKQIAKLYHIIDNMG